MMELPRLIIDKSALQMMGGISLTSFTMWLAMLLRPTLLRETRARKGLETTAWPFGTIPKDPTPMCRCMKTAVQLSSVRGSLVWTWAFGSIADTRCRVFLTV